LYRWLNFGKYRRLFPTVEGDAPVTLDWWVLDEDDELKLTEVQYPRNPGSQEISGEASANTFADVPPSRLKRYYPEAHTLLCLRDPVERAFSHYRMFQRFAKEGRRLPFPLTNFHDDAKREIDGFVKGKQTYFIGQGVYADRYMQWKTIFGERLLVVISEDLRDPHRQIDIMRKISARLGLGPHDFSGVLKTTFNTAQPLSIPESTEQMLLQFYTPFNDQLADALQTELPWR
jgi:hypothetical protein